MRGLLLRKNVFRVVILFLILITAITFLGLNVHYKEMFRRTLLLLTSLIVGARSVCDIPPSQWCLSEESATKCRVADQCVEWLSSSRNASRPTGPSVGPSASSNVNPTAPAPVDLAVYFESLCPDSTRFFREQLGPVFDQLASSGILKLSLIPYGNADEKLNATGWWEFTCQHGRLECRGNTLQTCAIHYLRYQSAYFPYVNCMMLKIEQGQEPDPAAQACAQERNVDYQLLSRCAAGRLGNQLEHVMAQQTDRLVPKKTYVPWVTLYGVHTEPMERQAESNLLKLVCDSYKGPKPPACLTNTPVIPVVTTV